MMNKTALVLAADENRKKSMVDNLSATGLFEHIKPLNSPSALFQHLKSDSADMVCWAVDKAHFGGDWITKLQSHECWHDLPVIAFAEDQQSLIRGFHLGASDSIHFAIDPHELSARIHRHLQHWQRLLELRKSQEQLQKMALTDPLTMLGNRATFDLSIKQTAARSQRTKAPYSLLLIDLDHFKNINDTYGHPTGDYVLQQAAHVFKEASRDSDICCRYGGEEFAIILPDTKAKNAKILANRIHQRLAGLNLQKGIKVRVSIGISSSSRMNNSQPETIIEEADTALYRAKQEGRNRTEIWQPAYMSLQQSGSFQSAPQLAFGT